MGMGGWGCFPLFPDFSPLTLPLLSARALHVSRLQWRSKYAALWNVSGTFDSLQSMLGGNGSPTNRGEKSSSGGEYCAEGKGPDIVRNRSFVTFRPSVRLLLTS